MIVQTALKLPQGVPLPDNPGGEHSNHIVQDESLEAWESQLGTLSESQDRVLEWIDACCWTGCTADEGWRSAPWCEDPNGFAPCVTRLKQMGMIVWRGDHRLTKKKNKAKVWVSARVWILYHLGEL